ncbi:MAG: HEAT repeat domain-containing protein [Candidatus Margulisiibacteriota bacterium]|jgi:HEAT repeat protein
MKVFSCKIITSDRDKLPDVLCQGSVKNAVPSQISRYTSLSELQSAAIKALQNSGNTYTTADIKDLTNIFKVNIQTLKPSSRYSPSVLAIGLDYLRGMAKQKDKDDDEAQSIAFWALDKLGGPAWQDLDTLAAYFSYTAHRYGVSDLINVGLKRNGEILPTLMELCRSDKDEVRELAVEAFGKVRDKMAISTLRLICKDDPSYKVRAEAANSLSKIGGQEGIGTLIALSRSGKEQIKVREAAVRALGNLGPDAKEAVPSLLVQIMDVSSEVSRKLIAEALGDIGELSAGTALQDLCRQNNNSEVRLAAAKALLKLGLMEMIPLAELVLIGTDKNEGTTVRCETLELLGGMATQAKENKNQLDTSKAIANTVPALRKIYMDQKDSFQVRSMVGQALDQIDPSRKWKEKSIFETIKGWFAGLSDELLLEE